MTRPQRAENERAVHDRFRPSSRLGARDRIGDRAVARAWTQRTSARPWMRWSAIAPDRCVRSTRAALAWSIPPSESSSCRLACPHPAGNEAAPSAARGKRRAANAASGWVTPDPAPPIHGRHRIGRGCSPVERGSHEHKNLHDNGCANDRSRRPPHSQPAEGCLRRMRAELPTRARRLPARVARCGSS